MFGGGRSTSFPLDTVDEATLGSGYCSANAL